MAKSIKRCCALVAFTLFYLSVFLARIGYVYKRLI